MAINTYLADKHVKSFVCWLEQKLDGPGSFPHSYYLKKACRNWRCSCLYEAYESYWWPFETFCPV